MTFLVAEGRPVPGRQRGVLVAAVRGSLGAKAHPGATINTRGEMINTRGETTNSLGATTSFRGVVAPLGHLLANASGVTLIARIVGRLDEVADRVYVVRAHLDGVVARLTTETVVGGPQRNNATLAADVWEVPEYVLGSGRKRRHQSPG